MKKYTERCEAMEDMTTTVITSKISESGLSLNIETADGAFYNIAFFGYYCIGHTDATYTKDYGSIGGTTYGIDYSKFSEDAAVDVAKLQLGMQLCKNGIFVGPFMKDRSFNENLETVIRNCLHRYVYHDVA